MFLGWMEEVVGDVKSPLTQSGYDVAEVWENTMLEAQPASQVFSYKGFQINIHEHRK